MHGWEDAQVVGDRGQHQVAVLEEVGDQVTDVGGGHVIQPGVGDPSGGELGGQHLGGGLGVSVHGGVDDHDALFLRLVGGPAGVFVDDVAQVFAPHRTVEGTQVFNVVQAHDVGGLVQQGHHLGAVLAHDVGVVPPGVVDPLPVEVELVGEQLAVQGAEGAKGVGGEQNAVGGVEGDHGLGPVDHRGVDKGHRVLAEALGIPLGHLLDGAGVQAKAELVEQSDRLGSGDDLHVGPAQQNLLDGGGVVGLHVVDDQIVQGAAVEDGLHVGDELPAHRPVGGVEEDGLLVQQDVGVVGHAVVQGVDVLKQGQPVLVRAYPVQVVGDHTVIIHREFPPFNNSCGGPSKYHQTDRLSNPRA